MAIGAMKQLHDSGVATPDAVSVIGFDDVAIAPYMVPSLSSVRIPVTEMIKETISRLIFMLDGGEFKYQQTFSGELVCATLLLTARTADVDSCHRHK
jgi:LacI family asc operon transcriptional repressor